MPRVFWPAAAAPSGGGAAHPARSELPGGAATAAFSFGSTNAASPHSDVDCKFFLEGTCKRGTECAFRHDERKARPARLNASECGH